MSAEAKESETSDFSSGSDSDSDKANECENALVYIRNVSKAYLEEMHEVPLSNTPIDVETEQEEIEEVDHLSPLIMDNHTVLEHRELFKESLNNLKEFHPGASHYRTSSLINHVDQSKDSTGTDSDSRSMSSFERRRDSSGSAHHDYSSDAVSSDENAKDSCDAQRKESTHSKEHHQSKSEEDEDDEPIEIPTDEMAEKIVQQVEFYFSNDNILKDAFLLKHVRRNKEGFVSLKLISSFKRVRQLVKDWRVVGYAIKLKSKNIEVNDLGTKIRRIEPLPVFDETMPSRTVVAIDLPMEKVTIEKVSEIFSKFGEIALIRILHAGGQIPPDVRQFMNKYPELHQKECAFVEFTESKSARNAMSAETDGGMHLYEMVAPKKKTGKKASVSKLIESYIYANATHSDSERNRTPANSSDFKLRRNSSNFYVKPEHLCNNLPPQNPQSISPTSMHHRDTLQSPRKYSFNNNNENCEHFGRRLSNTNDLSRKYSNCSEGYSSCSEMSRRTSNCSDISRRTSNCSDGPMFNRRMSGCSDFCVCSRRSSQCSDQYRRISQCSDHNRRFSNASMNFDRRMSNGSEGVRRISFDGDYDRKMSVGSNGCDHYRKISGTYDSMPRKYSNGDLRKTSVDSGYERKFSNASDYGSSPRSRSNSFLINKSENLVRTPIGPDGSKGFSTTRARKVGQVVVPV